MKVILETFWKTGDFDSQKDEVRRSVVDKSDIPTGFELYKIEDEVEIYRLK